MMRAGGRWTWFRIAEAAILLAFAALTVRNALVFPAIAGVDAAEHLRYARDLVFEHKLGTSASYYTPPGWYSIAGELLRLGDFLDLAHVEQPVQLLSALAAVASAILLLGVVRHAFPARPWLRIWALAAFCVAPTVVRLAAMPHPQTLVLLLTTLALFLLVRLLDSGRWGLLPGLALGVALGAAQLVRSVGIWIYAVAALALFVAFVVARRDRRRIAATASVALVLGALIPLPVVRLPTGRVRRPAVRRASRGPAGRSASDAVPSHPGDGGHRGRCVSCIADVLHRDGSLGIDHAPLQRRA